MDTYLLPYGLKNRIDLYEQMQDIPRLVNEILLATEPHAKQYAHEALEKVLGKTSSQVDDILEDFIP